MFAPEERVSLREVARMSLSGRCDVTRKTRVRQPNGTYIEVTATVASNMPCRKVPTGQTPEERMVLEGTQLTGRGVATFLVDGLTTIYKDDQIVYPTGAGKKYGVIGVLARTDGELVRAIVYDDSGAP